MTPEDDPTSTQGDAGKAAHDEIHTTQGADDPGGKPEPKSHAQQGEQDQPNPSGDGKS